MFTSPTCCSMVGEKFRRIINSSPFSMRQASIWQSSTLFVSLQLETFIARSEQSKPEQRICKEWMWREYGERKHRMETRQSHHRMVPFWGLSACLQYNCCLTPYELPSTTMWNLHKTVTIMSKKIKNKGVYMVIWFMVKKKCDDLTVTKVWWKLSIHAKSRWLCRLIRLFRRQWTTQNENWRH